MKKIAFSLLLGLVLFSCQNTPKTAENPANTAETTAATAQATPEGLQNASTSLAENVKNMEDMRKQVDALPANIKKDKAAEIQAIYANLEGMIEKQTGMMNEINSAIAPDSKYSGASQESAAPAGLSAAQIKDYTESAARYAQETQAMQEALAKMKN